MPFTNGVNSLPQSPRSMPEKKRTEFRNSARLEAGSVMSHKRGQPVVVLIR